MTVGTRQRGELWGVIICWCRDANIIKSIILIYTTIGCVQQQLIS